jgi:RNA polymerase sigma factor (sigma-70 family)
MKYQLVNLGASLRSLRRNAHKSQEALADTCRGLGLPITRDMIVSWETNRSEMPAQLIPLIAYALNAQVADLLPDLRKSAFTDLQWVSAMPGDPAKNVQKPTAQALANPSARVISEPAKDRCRANGVKSAFLAENDTSPLDALILSETRLQLMTLIRTLHHRHRQVLLLRYYSGLKLREIAALLNLPYSNVYARLESACGKLRRLLYCDSRWGWLRDEFRDQFPPWRSRWKVRHT